MRVEESEEGGGEVHDGTVYPRGQDTTVPQSP